MAAAPISKKRTRGNPNHKTGLIGVSKNRKKYRAGITYGGTQHSLGTFDTKEQAGIAYDRFVVDKSTEEVSFTLNYPNMSDSEREEALKVEEPPKKKRKRGNPNRKTGLIGVTKNGKQYKATVRYGGKPKFLGRFDTKEQAGIAYDRFVVDKSTEEVSFILNYPKMSDHEREEALKVEEPVQQKRGNPNQTTGLIGVHPNKKRYMASFFYGGKSHHLGTFDTKEQAGIAYDAFVVGIRKSTEVVSFALNYPNMSDLEREEALNVEEPVQKKRGKPNQTTGLIGVYKTGEKFQALIRYGGTSHHLGRFDTKEQAGIAYDRFAIDKSTEEVSFALNYLYPNMTDPERKEALKVEPPPKNRKRGSEEENDDGSSSSSDSAHSSDDDESDDEEEAVGPTLPPQAAPFFERDPMLDQLFADAQNKKQQQQQQDQWYK
jgi:serine protease inhibitor ecotin